MAPIDPLAFSEPLEMLVSAVDQRYRKRGSLLV
jgi:hypothetical protein